MNSHDAIFCPICNRTIEAENKADVLAGLHGGYVFVHDDINHPDNFTNDYEAMKAGVQ